MTSNGIVTYVGAIVPELEAQGHVVSVLSSSWLIARPPQGSTTSSNTRRARHWRSGFSIVSRWLRGRDHGRRTSGPAGRLPPLPGWRSPSTASSSSRSKSRSAGPWACGGGSRSHSSCGFTVHGSSTARPMDIPPTPRSALGSRRKGWALGAADGITAPSLDVLERTRAYYGLALEHAEVIPNPVPDVPASKRLEPGGHANPMRFSSSGGSISIKVAI